ncbi:unnamed protein product [Protopolystoma xenopodis]|uniref:Uncharacterized protein n=1 Tax=Protopolystoma xenopodis TaxID=117903 RepID=A0A3S5AQV9_9PLAT|nr:unnamed protein product [Protopolystoma xenopodis]
MRPTSQTVSTSAAFSLAAGLPASLEFEALRSVLTGQPPVSSLLTGTVTGEIPCGASTRYHPSVSETSANQTLAIPGTGNSAATVVNFGQLQQVILNALAAGGSASNANSSAGSGQTAAGLMLSSSGSVPQEIQHALLMDGGNSSAANVSASSLSPGPLQSPACSTSLLNGQPGTLSLSGATASSSGLLTPLYLPGPGSAGSSACTAASALLTGSHGHASSLQLPASLCLSQPSTSNSSIASMPSLGSSTCSSNANSAANSTLSAAAAAALKGIALPTGECK